jgi:curved DNA-binding protein
MEFKDYYATLGVPRTATQDEVKRAYRKLARKYHPDVSKEPDAEARFKEVAEAHEALIDPERRAAYDDLAQRHASGQPFEPPPGWDSGFEYSGRGNAEPGGRQARRDAGEAADFSDFFESLFGRGGFERGDGRHRRGTGPAMDEAAAGRDHHAKVAIGLLDACQGAQRTISLRMPVRDATGRSTLVERQLEVAIPLGVRRASTCGWPGRARRAAAARRRRPVPGDRDPAPHPLFRLRGARHPVRPAGLALGSRAGGQRVRAHAARRACS